MSDKITASDVRELLRARFGNPSRYAVAEEVGNSTGMGQSRRLDMVVVSCWESDGFSIEGIEVKVSKSDLKHELENPQKHNLFFADLDFYSLAAPRDVIDMDVIPKHWGVYEVYRQKDGELKLRCKRRPIALDDHGHGTVSRGFMASLCRHLYALSPSHSLIREAERRGYERAVREEPGTEAYRIRYLEDLLSKANEELSEFKAFYFIEGWAQGIRTLKNRAEKLSMMDAVPDPGWVAERSRTVARDLVRLADFLCPEEGAL